MLMKILIIALFIFSAAAFAEEEDPCADILRPVFSRNKVSSLKGAARKGPSSRAENSEAGLVQFPGRQSRLQNRTEQFEKVRKEVMDRITIHEQDGDHPDQGQGPSHLLHAKDLGHRPEFHKMFTERWDFWATFFMENPEYLSVLRYVEESFHYAISAIPSAYMSRLKEDGTHVFLNLEDSLVESFKRLEELSAFLEQEKLKVYGEESPSSEKRIDPQDYTPEKIFYKFILFSTYENLRKSRADLQMVGIMDEDLLALSLLFLNTSEAEPLMSEIQSLQLQLKQSRLQSVERVRSLEKKAEEILSSLHHDFKQLSQAELDQAQDIIIEFRSFATVDYNVDPYKDGTTIRGELPPLDF